MVTERYPPLGFSFTVRFEGLEAAGYTVQKYDAEFQSVSGLSVEIGTEDYTEGGENRFVHKLPVRTKYPNLVLKRGLIADSELIHWIRDAIENAKYKPLSVNITLQNENRQPLMTWDLKNVYPLKWDVDSFNAEESKIVIESMEFAYNYFTSKPVKNAN